MRQPWQVRLRLALLVKRDSRWNAWVRDITAWLERPYLNVWPLRPKPPTYPYQDGDFTVIGPECFRLTDDPYVISYRGENYTPRGERWA